MKKIILFFAIIGIFTVAAISAYAHSGRTNQWGCHYVNERSDTEGRIEEYTSLLSHRVFKVIQYFHI